MKAEQLFGFLNLSWIETRLPIWLLQIWGMDVPPTLSLSCWIFLLWTVMNTKQKGNSEWVQIYIVTGITINLGLSLTKKMVQKDCAPTKGKWYGWIWMPASKVSHVYIVVLEDRNLKIWISKQKRANLNIIMCWWHVWDILSNIV